jgi:hypothetical protein
LLLEGDKVLPRRPRGPADEAVPAACLKACRRRARALRAPARSRRDPAAVRESVAGLASTADTTSVATPTAYSEQLAEFEERAERINPGRESKRPEPLVGPSRKGKAKEGS